LIEFQPNVYINNGKRFQLLCFTKNSTYSICCESESERETFDWVDIFSKNIQKKKDVLTQSNIEENKELERSLLRNRVVLKRKDLTTKEIEFHVLRKKLWGIERQIRENKFEISYLEEETNELNQDLTSAQRRLETITQLLDSLKEEFFQDSTQIEKTDIEFWKYFGRDFDVKNLIY
jgi:chromosome segregation ATPase